MEQKTTYKAVDSNGIEFEVPMAKHEKPAAATTPVRAPNAPVSFQSRPAAVQSGAR